MLVGMLIRGCLLILLVVSSEAIFLVPNVPALELGQACITQLFCPEPTHSFSTPRLNLVSIYGTPLPLSTSRYVFHQNHHAP